MRVKRLLNSLEAETDRQLTAVALRHGARVFAKVRVADVLSLDDRTESSAVSFAIKAHFDFVVADSSNCPLFAVEFDGPLHATGTQAARDAQKGSLCGRCGFPILRTKATHLTRQYRGLSLLAWFTEVWFAAGEFRRLQAEGNIPASEPFDPTFFVSIPGHERSFPLMLSAGACKHFRRWALEGRIRDFGPSFYIGRDASGTYRATSWLLVSDSIGVVARTAMRAAAVPSAGAGSHS